VVGVRTFDPATMGVGPAYKLITDVVVPRPIAFVTTLSSDGKGNLAPFSYFNAVSTEPPCLMISVTGKRDGSPKDTLRNILDTKQFVVNIATVPMAEAVHQTGVDYPHGVDEMEKVGLHPIASEAVRPPRVRECPVQIECELHHTVTLGTPGTSGATTLVIGRILRIHVADEVFDGERVDPVKLDPLARLGLKYSGLGQVFELGRPKPAG
jgi:flavin reductase (DIM6/NTAB) family NADH-FMN oxidoreductase RutF